MRNVPHRAANAAVFVLLATGIAACGSEPRADVSDTGDNDVCRPGECEDGGDVALDAAADGSGPDTDAGTDAATDAATDEGTDTAEDVAPDTVEDVAADAAPDAPDTADAAPEVLEDAASDGSGDADVSAPATFYVSIGEPRPRTSIALGDEIDFVGYFESETIAPAEVSVQWISSLDGVISDQAFDGSGQSAFTATLATTGSHEITLEAVAAGEAQTARVEVAVCDLPVAFPFDTDLGADWEVLFSASRDSRGWLEMTGNSMGQKGAIANTARPIASGDVRIRFDVSTGQCFEPGPCSGGTGADGFAVSFFDTDSGAETVALLERARTGGGLGYGVSGEYGDDEVDAFHIELDTWHNVYNGTNEFHTDPTTENHIAITLDGDPGNHVVWVPLAGLEDNQWHTVEIGVNGSRVRIWFDEMLMADEVVEGLRFKGGFLAFTGTTGYYTNYHRFDNLSILEGCSL